MIAILDYGLGNVRAFANVYKRLSIQHYIAREGQDLDRASKIIFPGVGAFDHAMDQFKNSGLRSALEHSVLINKTPVLGICVGMQMLAHSSDEGQGTGLGWISGNVRRFSNEQAPLLPHMGWNDIEPTSHPLFDSLEPNPRYYFLHSYYYECDDSSHAIAHASYGDRFTCAVNRGNVYGVQFHPEKSHHNGVQLLKNFATL